MSVISLFVLAVGLAMDATAVAAASAFAAPRVRVRDALLLATAFGGAQALMPALGWWVGARFAAYVQAWDHWLIFVLLAGIGGKMIHEALSHRKQSAEEHARELAKRRDAFHPATLAVMALATSIDALAAGVTLPLLGFPVGAAVACIGLVTFALCLGGVAAGRRFGEHLGEKLDVLGGVVLIGLGVKTLVQHLSGAG
ncbi:MAG: manganese efflux pump MntP family protein [Myxococcaceae bacterium]|nr:manganese efflux pump MntP family protein [Myxococcaceae bacterium]